jgi:succinate-semialdehyde dehydrogenase/glutarate-semialdehyde dehydrogenase
MNAPRDLQTPLLKDGKLFHQQCYIDGQWSDADNRQTIPVTNPATGAPIGSVPKMGAAETRRAIEAADRALPAWRGKLAKNAQRSCASGSNDARQSG